MLSITAHHTMLHHGHKHVCLKHEFKVGKTHVDNCDLLNKDLKFKVTVFNEELNTERLFS